MKFSYTQRDEPNYKIRSARYRCKSYRLYKCTAKLEIKEIEGRDKYFLIEEHSQNCIAMNGAKSETAGDSQSNFEDITILFKKGAQRLHWIKSG